MAFIAAAFCFYRGAWWYFFGWAILGIITPSASKELKPFGRSRWIGREDTKRSVGVKRARVIRMHSLLQCSQRLESEAKNVPQALMDVYRVQCNAERDSSRMKDAAAKAWKAYEDAQFRAIEAREKARRTFACHERTYSPDTYFFSLYLCNYSSSRSRPSAQVP